MNFIPISSLRQTSGYRDRRSIKKWVERSLGIELHKVGKNWCVVQEEYEKALRLRYADRKPIKKLEKHYVPKTETERTFLSELDDLLREDKEV